MPEPIRLRYPPPWRAVEIPGGWSVVSSNNVAVAYVYAFDKTLPLGAASGTSSTGVVNYVSRAEAKAIAHAIAALPDLLPS